MLIQTVSNPLLPLEIGAAMGQSVRFSNGCWLKLVDDNGIFWGDTPYGLSWGCNVDQEWLNKVLNWLAYWDEPRDERGSCRAYP